MNELNETTPPTRSQQRRTERRRRARKARLNVNQPNDIKSEFKPTTETVRAPHKKLTLDDLDEDQKEAYYGIKAWWEEQLRIGGIAKPIVLSGYSGSGKSTLMGLILSDLYMPDGSIPFVESAAYTGKAADVLRKKGIEANTLHCLLYNWKPEDGILRPVKKTKEQIGADLIVVDESSMLDNDLRKDLEALKIPIIYLGDIGQLSAIVKDKKDVRPNVMANPDFMLTHIHRQALESGIISVATDVRLGKPITNGVYGINKDMVKVGNSAIEDIELLANADAVICHKNITRHYYNDKIRTYKGFSGNFPEVGERLICIKNNRQLDLVNGLVVYVKYLSYEKDTLIMDLEDEIGRQYNSIKVHPQYFLGEDHPSMKNKITKNFFEFGYAMTCSKVQGSSFGNVVVVEEKMQGRVSEKRKWMYTAITRAEYMCTWISRFR